MKFIFSTTLAAFLFLASAMTTAAGDKFLSVIDDLPLMAELDEIKGSAMTFDSPQGRVVEAMAMGNVEKDKVFRFYSATLPQLGWTESRTGQFSREGEILKIEFLKIENGSGESGAMRTIQFMLSPAQ